MTEENRARVNGREVYSQKVALDAVMERVCRGTVIVKIEQERVAVWEGKRGQFPRSRTNVEHRCDERVTEMFPQDGGNDTISA